MPTMWEKIKKTAKHELSDAAAKTGEYAKIGKAKLDIMNLNNSMNHTFQELGTEVFTQITEGIKGEIPQNPKVKGLVQKINQLKQSIKEKELEIEAVKK